MMPRPGRPVLALGLAPGASWTAADVAAIGSEHMTNLVADRHDRPIAGPGGRAPTPHATRRDTVQALSLLLGTLGILFGMALLIGSPIGSFR